MVQCNLKISAILCTFNEEYCLDECLQSIAWADEIILCDMGSTDGTIEIALRHKCSIHKIDWVPYVELARKQAVSFCKHDWICFIDPDFIFPSKYSSILQRKINESPDITCAHMAYVNHYKKYPVAHGRWGAIGYYPVLFKKDAMEILPILHGGFKLLRGRQIFIPSHIYIKHMWIRNEKHFYEKHRRYIDHEGERRRKLGMKPSWRRKFKLILQMLKLYLRDGYKDGKIGFDLLKKSIWYEMESEKSLDRAFKEIKHGLNIVDTI